MTSLRLFIFALALLAPLPAQASDRVPGKAWERYVDVAEAGFDADRLEAAHEAWQAMPSSAFLVISGGVVVASWGDIERRFMCHSVRKSFLTALYGIYWDRGEIDLNETLADLGIDDHPEPLLPSERQARILDLLKARSGVFHPAAYAGRTDSRPRGSEGPGRYFAYNNWDFNTAAAILQQEADVDIFEAFEEHFGQPLGMEDWRTSDGYYHYERDKSRYPAYPFRLSARDAARFGLLFAREGQWGDQRILSRHWVRRSAAMYSIDSEQMGYGFMWWVMREPRFAQYGMYAALGVGNQMIAVLPDLDMVIVNRANTYIGERTPMQPLLSVIEQVLEARVGPPDADARLVAVEEAPEDPRQTTAARADLEEIAGEFAYPPPSLGLPRRTSVRLEVRDGHLLSHSPNSGTFRHFLQPDGSLVEEDSWDQYFVLRDASGIVEGIANPGSLVGGALVAAAEENGPRARQLFAMAPQTESTRVPAAVTRQLIELLAGDAERAEADLRTLTGENDSLVERIVNELGYRLLGAEQSGAARSLFEVNTRLFPESANVWDSLAEAHLNLGNTEEAIRFYRKTLEMNDDNPGARAALEALASKD